MQLSALRRIVIVALVLTTQTTSCNVGRSAGIPLEKIQERREFIVGAHLAGFSTRTILQQVNGLAEFSGWGRIASVRTVERTIAGHFRDAPMSIYEIRSYQSGMRESELSRQHKLIEMASMELRRPREWKENEKIQAIATVFRMTQTLIENRGWNLSKLPYKRFKELGYRKPVMT